LPSARTELVARRRLRKFLSPEALTAFFPALVSNHYKRENKGTNFDANDSFSAIFSPNFSASLKFFLPAQSGICPIHFKTQGKITNYECKWCGTIGNIGGGERRLDCRRMK